MPDRPVAKPSEPMLRDEALYWLLDRLENQPRVGSLTIAVDHGEFVCSYGVYGDRFVGEQLPNLTDALCSLIGCMP